MPPGGKIMGGVSPVHFPLLPHCTEQVPPLPLQFSFTQEYPLGFELE